jgi:hypothetical protein
MSFRQHLLDGASVVWPFVAPMKGPLALLAVGFVPAVVAQSDRGDVIMVSVGILVLMFTLRVLFRDLDNKNENRYVEHNANDEARQTALLASLTAAQKYPAEVARVYGPVSRSLRRMEKAVAALQRDGHTHDMGSAGIRPHQRPPPDPDDA